MAKLLPNFMFLGSMSNVSAYTRQGSDNIILRTKGGPSKQKIKTSPDFEVVRKNNKEFGGRSAASSRLLMVLEYFHPVADYSIAGSLNSLLRHIQVLDTESEKGQRHVLISRQPKLLQGFNLNKKFPFDSMLRNPVEWSIAKETLSAKIEFPALIPGTNFFLPDGHYPVYQLVTVLAVIPDVFYGEVKYKPLPAFMHYTVAKLESTWFPVSAGSPAQQLELQLPPMTETGSFSLMLAAGVRFGRFNATGGVDPAKYIGCAKIVGMA